eukprot:jgi/Botrbrau1/21373/Bobra.0422s0002.1
MLRVGQLRQEALSNRLSCQTSWFQPIASILRGQFLFPVGGAAEFLGCLYTNQFIDNVPARNPHLLLQKNIQKLTVYFGWVAAGSCIAVVGLTGAEAPRVEEGRHWRRKKKDKN